MYAFWQQKRVEADNDNLHKEVTYLRNESDLLDWYVKYMEQGRCTRQLMKMHAYLERKHARLLERYNMMVDDFEAQIKELNEKIEELKNHLKKQQE